ncbi:MAG TPA: DUF5652 family protein [Candidatus Pacearchaeota archaeon]|nr:DUF5652 family protein [Candidatus Pacearchaeota archaeon]
MTFDDILINQDIVIPSDIKIIITILVFVELILKGFALWRAAKRGDKAWYIAVLVLNTLGLIPLIYLIITREKGDVDKS